MVPFDSLGPTWLCLSKSFWDPFHKSLRYILFSSIAILKNMTFLYTIVDRNEWHSIWLTLWKETRELFAFLFMGRCITKSSLPKNTILRAKNNFQVCFSSCEVWTGFQKIFHLIFESSAVFTRFYNQLFFRTINWITVNHFQMFEISF